MKLPKFNKKNKKTDSQANLAEVALRAIRDGIIMTDKDGVIEFINPAAANMTGFGMKAVGLDYGLVVKLESKEGRELLPDENPLTVAMKSGQPAEPFEATLIVDASGARVPVAISVINSEDSSRERIITMRDIAKELAEEGEQTEFISTASHEMRTPVATIDGYLSLCLNPQTATIDDRARNYLAAAQTASRHLGKLFQDLLDVTRLDDHRIRPNMRPVEMVELVSNITKDYEQRAKEAKINLTFGSDSPIAFGEAHVRQVAYGFVDENFLREILDNLIDNALKYTPDGGSVYVNVRGDGDRILINVTDTGIGISPEDLGHIFQKFYRADNSDTRTVGGTGLGLYLVKQRAEAMGGKVWAESAFGEGSTFYVSLPRLSDDEYEKRMIVVRNAAMMNQPTSTGQPAVGQSVMGQPTMAVQATPAAQATPVTQATTVAQGVPVAQGVSAAQGVPVAQAASIAQSVTARQPAPPIRPAPMPTLAPVPGPAPTSGPAPASAPASAPAQQQIDINLNGGRQ